MRGLSRRAGARAAAGQDRRSPPSPALRVTEPDLSSWVRAFDDGILDPRGWTSALAELAAVKSSSAASLVLWSRAADLALVGDQVGPLG